MLCVVSFGGLSCGIESTDFSGDFSTDDVHARMAKAETAVKEMPVLVFIVSKSPSKRRPTERRSSVKNGALTPFLQPGVLPYGPRSRTTSAAAAGMGMPFALLA
jgi:hypothetical protein